MRFWCISGTESANVRLQFENPCERSLPKPLSDNVLSWRKVNNTAAAGPQSRGWLSAAASAVTN